MEARLADLDQFDRRILALMQENSRRTGQELSALVGLSPAACLRRVQRLRDSGVILREIAIVAPKALGRRVTMIVMIGIERDRPDRYRLFMAEMRDRPEVTQCWQVTGDNDIVMTVEVEDMEAYSVFTERHFYEPYIKRFESIAVLGDAMR